MTAPRKKPVDDGNVEKPNTDALPLDLLLVDERQAAAMLSIGPTSIGNLESRDPTFPKPIAWPLDSKRWRRVDIDDYVARLKQRRA